MKICFITPRAKIHSGGEKSLLELIDYLLTKDIEISMIVLEKEGPLYEELDKRNIQYTHLQAEPWIAYEWEQEENYPKKFSATFEASVEIAKIVKQWNVDIIYTNTSIVNAGNIAAVLTDKPHVWHIRESIKDNPDYKLTMPFEHYAAVIGSTNNLSIFISQYLYNQYKDFIHPGTAEVIYDSVEVPVQSVPDAPKDIKVDIVIPFYNGEHASKTLESIIKYKSPSLNKVIFVDDKGPNREAALQKVKDLASKHDFIEIIENDQNRGFVHTANNGMKHSKNDVILLNDDTLVTKGWLERMKNVAYADEKHATVSPLSNSASYYSIPDQFNREFDGKPEESQKVLEAIAPFEYFPTHTTHGFCMYIKRSVINKVGLFNEKKFGFGYGEENEFCMRALAAGYTHAISARTYIYHLEGQSFSQKGDKKDFMANAEKVLRKEYPEIYKLEKEYHTHHWTDSICKTFPYFKQHLNILDEKKITIVGSIQPNKGQLDVVKAMVKLHNDGIKVHLLFVGEEGNTEYVKEIKDLASKEKITDYIHFLGTLDRPFGIMNMADVCVMSSYNEGWGRVTMEYMLVGKAVVGANNGGTTELIENEKTGLLYKPGDVDALTKNLALILKNESLAAKLGKAAKEKADDLLNKGYGEEIYKKLQSIENAGNHTKGISAYLSPWFTAKVIDGNVRSYLWWLLKHKIINRPLLFGTWRRYKDFRTRLAIKGRISKLFGKGNPYGEEDSDS